MLQAFGRVLDNTNIIVLDIMTENKMEFVISFRVQAKEFKLCHDWNEIIARDRESHGKDTEELQGNWGFVGGYIDFSVTIHQSRGPRLLVELPQTDLNR